MKYRIEVLWVYMACSMLLIMVACSGGKEIDKVSGSGEYELVEDSIDVSSFPLPEIPVLITDAEARLDYLLIHYWDLYDFTDSTRISIPEYTEQGLVNFLYLLKQVGEDSAIKALDRLIDRMNADKRWYYWFMDKLENYLDNPNSPIYSEGMFAMFLERIVSSDKYSELEKSTPTYKLRMIRKNSVGTVAADFSFLTQGGVRQLNHLAAEYVLVLFYDPECDNCRHVKDELASSELVKQLLERKNGSYPTLVLLTVAMEGTEEQWEQYVLNLPKQWINGYDRGEITRKDLYSIRSFPSIYLLDRDKRVVLKDVDVFSVLEYMDKQVLYLTHSHG